MKRYYVKLGFILILLSLMMSFNNVAAETIDSYSAETQILKVNESSIESDMPVGGWSPMEGHEIEEDMITEEPTVFHFQSVLSSPLDDVFLKGASRNGYNALSKDGQKTYYEQIDSAAVSFMKATNDLQTTRINSSDVYVVAKLDFSSVGLTRDEARQSLFAYDYDHPAYYWLSDYYWYGDSYVYLCTYKEYASASYRKSLNNKIINGVKKYAALTEKTDDVFEKIAIVHDGIITEVDYAYEEDGKKPVDDKWAHSVQGVFDSTYSHVVCEGYSEAFSLIMNYLDIPNYYIAGINKNGVGHAWNAVSDDEGATYMYMDLTWDDLGKDAGFYHKYFGMPSSDFEKDHGEFNSSGTGTNRLYDISAEVTNDFEGTYYYKAGFYCSVPDDYKEFAEYTRTKAYRFGTIFSCLTDDLNVMIRLAQEYDIFNTISYYDINYNNKNYYAIVVTDINKVDLSKAEINLGKDKFVYTGEEVKPEIEGVILNGVKLIKDDNYTVEYSDDIINPGTATLIIKGIGAYEGTAEKNYTILPKLADDDKEYYIAYTWSDDGKTCTAIAVYSDNYIIDETATITEKVSKEATCIEQGITTYTASFNNNIFTTQTKDVVDIPISTIHIPGDKVIENEVSATCDQYGSYDEVVYCSVCGAEISRNTFNVDALGKTTTSKVEEKESGSLTKKADTSTQSSEKTAASSQTEEAASVEQTANSQNKINNKTFNVITSETGETTLEYKLSAAETVSIVVIPNTQTINGVTYKVTRLAAGTFADNKTIEKVMLGSNIESIGDNAFKGCTNLKTITIPEGVKEIGDSVFEGCTMLNNVSIGSEVTEIGDNAFANCSSLTKVIIPAKVTKIKKNAFKNNKNLKTIIIKSKKIKSIGKNAFKNINNKAIFYVPKKLTNKQFTKYKKMIKNSGVSKKVKIKKK